MIKDIVEKYEYIMFGFSPTEDSDIVGAFTLIDKGNDAFMLHAVAMKEQERGKGYGHLMMSDMIAEARKLGAKSIRLDTSTNNIPAVKIYERVGFRDTFGAKESAKKHGHNMMMSMRLEVTHETGT